MQNPDTVHPPAGPAPAFGGRIIVPGLATGHVVFHWILQSFVVVLPEIQQAFQLNTVGVGGILSARDLAAGLVALPGGVVVDILRRYWGQLLASCLAVCALGCLALAVSPVYPLLLIGMAVVAISHSIWHLPASHPFPTTSRNVAGLCWPPTASEAVWATWSARSPRCAAGLSNLARAAQRIRRRALFPGRVRHLVSPKHRVGPGGAERRALGTREGDRPAAEVASTGLGIVTCIAFLMSTFSPLIAGALYETLGFAAAVYYIGALFVAAALVFVSLPLSRSQAEPAAE